MRFFTRSRSTAVILGLVLLGTTPGSIYPQQAATVTAGSQTQKRLQPLVERLVEQAKLSATVCVYVEDVTGGEVVADINGEKPLAPASCNKLVTTAVGLSTLGPDHTFKTRFFATGPIKDGVLQGDLIIYGGGDPTISGRFQEDKQDITSIMREWAAKLKAAGITKISGKIVADDSFFDEVYFHSGWAPGERGEWYSAEVSALAFNDNCIDINWSAKGKLPEEKAVFGLNPETSYTSFTSEVVVAAKGRPTERYYARGASDNNIVATGNLTVDTVNPDSAAVHDGALYCTTVFHEVLEKEGVDVTGSPAKSRGAAAKIAGNPIFEHVSPNLLKVCEVVNLNSQNFYAECVAKAVAREKSGEGSWAAARKTIQDFCKTHNIYSEGHAAVDGSGLSGANRVTGRQLVGILRFMDNNGIKDQWRGTLPQGEKRGSLKSRFQDTPEGRQVDQRILGKTGLIGGVRSLSGIVTDASGRELYYSIILNQLRNAEAAEGMKLIDKIAVELARSGGASNN